jgi:23S rRNA (cytidine1920-2'-O)/16S rRNA (cytidine1409-2'-O)-methyltransferase
MTAPDRSRHRLDQLLVLRGLAPSRSRARALIEAGLVLADRRPADRPSQVLAPDADLEVTGRDHPWVSRGGVKLTAALDHFEIDPTGLVALDIGASTGGFTEVLLARGAARVYAVDVGHDQLAATLRADRRVVVHERVNARYLTRAEIPEPPALVTCDVSFIGLATILPAPLALAAPEAVFVALIKPQFEAGPGGTGKGGVVRSSTVHRDVCDRIARFVGTLDGWSVLGVIDSPIAGANGNREFLIAGRAVP